jgi:hypothetical protein
MERNTGIYVPSVNSITFLLRTIYKANIPPFRAGSGRQSNAIQTRLERDLSASDVPSLGLERQRWAIAGIDDLRFPVGSISYMYIYVDRVDS